MGATLAADHFLIRKQHAEGLNVKGDKAPDREGIEHWQGDAYDEALETSPLMAFSLYTDVQVQLVRKKGAQILQTLDNSVTRASDGTLGINIGNAQGEFWFWVLGAYEVVRVMAPSRSPSKSPPYFVQRVRIELIGLLKQVTIYRIPFAKQKLQRGTDIFAELSATDWSAAKADFAFTIDGEQRWAREIILHFERVMSSIRRADVLHGLEARLRGAARFQ